MLSDNQQLRAVTREYVEAILDGDFDRAWKIEQANPDVVYIWPEVLNQVRAGLVKER